MPHDIIVIDATECERQHVKKGLLNIIAERKRNILKKLK